MGSNLVSEMTEILVGSCCQANVQRICSRLKGKAVCSITESWKAFELQSKRRSYSLHMTDLHFSDCFEAVAVDNLCRLDAPLPTIIILGDMNHYRVYRGKVQANVEIYPDGIVDDEDFISILTALRVKYKYLSDLL